MSRIYVAADLETTGTSPERDSILEVGLVKFRLPPTPGSPLVFDRWSSLVNPGRPIPHRVSRLTGISNDEVLGAPPLSALVEPIRAFVGNYPVVGHNVAFELAFLQRHGLLVGQASVDTFELASILLPDAPRYSLGELARYLGIPFDGWHRADADAEMAAELLHALWGQTLALRPDTLDAIVAAAARSDWRLRSFFAAAAHSQPDGVLPARAAPPFRHQPRTPDREAPPLQPMQVVASRPLDEIEALLGSTGAVGRMIPQYESRPQQVEMLRAVHRTFAQGRQLIVEAGTGTGKSLAYLLPALFLALDRGERVVVSTHTLNLQDQIFYDELGRLSHALPDPFTVVRLKGRANYLCTRRLAALQERPTLTAEQARLIARVLVWLESTTTGDRSELAIQRDEEAAWEQIACDGASCSIERCGAHGRCFGLERQQQAAAAHLVIVNHALLMSDIVAGGGLIPPYRYLIVDEAHHLEEQATQGWGAQVSHSTLLSTLDRLTHEQRGRAAGLLARLRDAARAERARDLSRIAERAALLVRSVEGARSAVEGWSAQAQEFASAQLRGDSRHRIRSEWRRWSEWLPLERSTKRLLEELQLLDEGLEPLGQALNAAAADLPSGWQEFSDDLHRLRLLLATQRDEVRRILLSPESNDVTWVEGGSGQQDFTLCRAPRDVPEQLNHTLFDHKRAVVLTSATLSVEGSFAFVRERLGVEDAEELSLGTPFSYADQALVYVVEDLPEPNQPSYGSSLHRSLIELARATRGRMLVLFTSKSQLNNAYHAISDPLGQEDIIVLGQYLDGSRTHLVQRFRTMERAVLLGTLSFWEGIDIPGEALSCVAITRLPFPVPTDPIQEARGERYANAFRDYSTPQAVLRLRQGVGRLLRRTSDRGVVALLDSRLVSKSYGSIFLDSLPTANVEIGPARQLYPMAERWLNR